MSAHTILVIDDSATIRRLVDATLSRDGYVVVLAPTAEEGIERASELRPDMILLDHQLPGTTGYEVCQSLISSPETEKIPVVVSSTLRKRAYAEYSDLPNVVDLLPKPYSEELLTTTVANALETGRLVVESQSQGTAVPEVIDAPEECDLNGRFGDFTVREVLDFLNNGRKRGALEIETDRQRYTVYLRDGRIQGITATGIIADEIISRLPEALSELAPVLKVTLSRGGDQLEGIVDLLNTNVLDPRLLKRLLRHQAAVLLTNCFSQSLKSFRFDTKKTPPPLFERLPIDISSLALLVEGAMSMDDESIFDEANCVFVRQPIRGQNLDRAGLAAQQARILSQLTEPRTIEQLAQILSWDAKEVRRVLHGLELAELVSTQPIEGGVRIVAFEHDVAAADRLKASFQDSEQYTLQVVTDPTAFELLVRRAQADVVVVDATTPDSRRLGESLRDLRASSKAAWVLAIDRGFEAPPQNGIFNACIHRPYTAAELLQALDEVSAEAATEPMNISISPESVLCPQ